MPNNLVIVESPAKSKTISGYLGEDYDVLATIGHIRDLQSRLGSIDPDNNFNMIFEISERSREQVKKIITAFKTADALYLATDPDREGEAIAWHLMELLQPTIPVKRLSFHEITKSAIQRWQKRKGYAGTGEVTEEQLARLEQEAITRLAEKQSEPKVAEKKKPPRLDPNKVFSASSGRSRNTPDGCSSSRRNSRSWRVTVMAGVRRTASI